MVVGFLFASTLMACGGGGSSLPPVRSSLNAIVPMQVSTMSKRRSAIAPLDSAYVAINAGGSAATGGWLADTDFIVSGGSGIEHVNSSINTTKVSNPAPQAVYQTQRFAKNLTYTVATLVPHATYSLRLHFVESYFTLSGKRVFNVALNGQPALTNFDVFQAAGGANIAIVEQFNVTADASGKIAIAMTGIVNYASIAGIEASTVLSSPTPAPAASPIIELNAGGGSAGKWLSDQYYAVTGWNGTATVSNSIDTSKVPDPGPQSVYQTQRYANSLTYTVPSLTAGAQYTVRLHFVESWWTAVNKRLFNVTINGSTVLTNFDIYRTAGGQNIAIVAVYPTVADQTGSIVVKMTASVDNAAIAGIEVLTPGTLASPTPSPSPTPTATSTPTTSGLPYVFAGSSAYSTAQGNGNPLFTPINSLNKTRLSSTVVQNFWSPGLASGDSPLNANGPVYVVSSTVNSDAPVLTFEANGFGSNRFSGTKVHVPTWAVNQCGSINEVTSGNSDCHMEIIDYINNIEVSGWECVNGGAGGTFNGAKEPGQLFCTWGGVSPIGGTGLRSDGYDATHSGFSEGAVDVTPQEILNAENGTPIEHAFMIGTRCLNNPTVYPADTTNGSDSICSGDTSGTVYPAYGDLVQLVANPTVPVAAHSLACQAVLRAMQTYGAYLGDTGGQIQMLSFSDFVYSSDPTHPGDPWKTVVGQMTGSGDASGSYNVGGNGSGWSSCLQGLQASDFEMYALARP